MTADPKTPFHSKCRRESSRFQVQELRGHALDRALIGWGLSRRPGESDAQLRHRALRLFGLFDPDPRSRPEATIGRLALSFVVLALVAAALAALAGCEGHTPTARLVVFEERGINAPPHELEALPPEVQDACDLLPLYCEAWAFRPHGGGTVEVHLLPDGMRRGRLVGRRACWASVMARASDPVAIAHELGHAFGLDDVDDDGEQSERLMDYDAHGAEPGDTWADVLTDAEVERVMRSAGAMEWCP